MRFSVIKIINRVLPIILTIAILGQTLLVLVSAKVYAQDNKDQDYYIYTKITTIPGGADVYYNGKRLDELTGGDKPEVKCYENFKTSAGNSGSVGFCFRFTDNLIPPTPPSSFTITIKKEGYNEKSVTFYHSRLGQDPPYDVVQRAYNDADYVTNPFELGTFSIAGGDSLLKPVKPRDPQDCPINEGTPEERTINVPRAFLIGGVICGMVQLVSGAVVAMLNLGFEKVLLPSIGLSDGRPDENGNPRLPLSAQIKTIPFVQAIWRVNIVLVDTLLILALIFIAIVNIAHLQIDAYAIKKILPTLMVAVILAHFSMLITQLVIETSEVLVVNFVPDGPRILISHLVNAVGWTAIFDTLGLLGLAVAVMAGWIVAILFTFLPIILVLVLGLMLWLRHLALIVLVMFAPIGLAAMALPVTKKLFQNWLGVFTRVTYMSTIAMIFLYFASLFGAPPDIRRGSGLEAAPSFTDNFAQLIIPLLLLGLAIFAPIMLGRGIPVLGNLLSGIGGLVNKGVKLVGISAGRRADTTFAGLTSEKGLGRLGLGKIPPLAALGIGSAKGMSTIGVAKGWRQSADRRWNTRMEEMAGHGEDIREMATHLPLSVQWITNPRAAQQQLKATMAAPMQRFDAAQRQRLLTEGRSMAENSDDSTIRNSLQGAIGRGNKEDAQRALLAAAHRGILEPKELDDYRQRFDSDFKKSKGKVASAESLQIEELAAYEGQKVGKIVLRQFARDDQGAIVSLKNDPERQRALTAETVNKMLSQASVQERPRIIARLVQEVTDAEGNLNIDVRAASGHQRAIRDVLQNYDLKDLRDEGALFRTRQGASIDVDTVHDVIHEYDRAYASGVQKDITPDTINVAQGVTHDTRWREAADKIRQMHEEVLKKTSGPPTASGSAGGAQQSAGGHAQSGQGPGPQTTSGGDANPGT